MAKELFKPRYTKEFKRKVIEEYLATGCTKISLIRKYKIDFVSAVQTWMRIMGYRDYYREIEMSKFEQPILIPLSKQTNKQDLDLAALQKRIRDLERQLEEEKLRSEAYARVIEKAELELKIPIRKKPDTR